MLIISYLENFDEAACRIRIDQSTEKTRFQVTFSFETPRWPPYDLTGFKRLSEIDLLPSGLLQLTTNANQLSIRATQFNKSLVTKVSNEIIRNTMDTQCTVYRLRWPLKTKDYLFVGNKLLFFSRNPRVRVYLGIILGIFIYHVLVVNKQFCLSFMAYFKL